MLKSSFARRWRAPSLTATVCLTTAAMAYAQQSAIKPAPVNPDTWTAIDALGRALPGHGEIGDPRANRTVGMFYFLWLGEHGSAGPFDITRILQKDPDAMAKPDSPLWGPVGAPHHWGESVFGYYRSDDPYVLRKHAQMLANAGVDTVVFDVTNNLTYPRSWHALGETWSQVRKEGGRTPRFAFLAPFGDPAAVVQTLYEDLYKPGLYADLWFRWDGKPLILADPDMIRPERMAESHRTPGLLAAHETYGQSFTAAKPFTAVGASFPTYSSTASSVTLSLYSGGRPGGKRLATKRFRPLKDNAVVLLELPETAPAGSYYLEQSDPDGQVGWWSETGNVYPGGKAWASGAPVRGARNISIRYSDSGDAPAVPLFLPQPPDPARMAALADEIRSFFTFRKPQPSYFTGPTTPNQWGWLEVTPQKPFTKPDGTVEEVPVGVAQNAVDGKLSVLSNPRSYGRSFHEGAEPPPGQYDFTGRNFQEQWDVARKLDPSFVFVTGWNEWIAGRFGEKSPFYAAGNLSFVDEFDHEFSRDIEPVVGGHTDSYYYQLVANVRRYKGMSPPAPPAPALRAPLAMPPVTEAERSAWRRAGAEWSDDPFDIPARDHAGWSGPGKGEAAHYTNTGNGNDFVTLRVAHDSHTLYLYARTREPIRNAVRPGSLTVLLSSGARGVSTWEGFDFVLNRSNGVWLSGLAGQGTVRLEQHAGKTGQGRAGWKTALSAVPCAIQENEMFLAVPLNALGIDSRRLWQIDIKWTDGIDWEADSLNLYRDGDTAPDGRFRYHYRGLPTKEGP